MEGLYDFVFKSIKKFLIKINQYILDIQAITTDTKIALLNSLSNNLENFTRIGYLFYLKQNLLKYAKIYI